MKKNVIKVSLFLSLAAILPLQSCIGSFSLTNKVISWNNQVGSKFLNELVFFAFWILPVYEVTAVADLLVINSIEFWSGSNPVLARTSQIETEQGIYIVESDEKGYTITAPNGYVTRLVFTEDDKTWSVKVSDTEVYPFMTMLDASHVKMITPDGSFKEVEISEQGLMAYTQMITSDREI